MIDRDNVIKGLEYCESGRYCYGPMCPYFGEGHCTEDLMHDALELIKAQQPRVLTLEEVITSKPGTVVWLEDFDKPDVISGLFKRLFIHTKVIDFLIVKEEVSNEVTADLDVYGSDWRCWSQRPTDEQREAVSWDD